MEACHPSLTCVRDTGLAWSPSFLERANDGQRRSSAAADDGTPAGTAGRRHGACGAQLSAARPPTGGHAHRGRVSALLGFGAPAPHLHSRATAPWFTAGRNRGNPPLPPSRTNETREGKR